MELLLSSWKFVQFNPWENPKGAHLVLKCKIAQAESLWKTFRQDTQLCSDTRLCLTVCDPMDCARLPCPWDFSGKDTEVGSRGSSRLGDQAPISCIGRRTLPLTPPEKLTLHNKISRKFGVVSQRYKREMHSRRKRVGGGQWGCAHVDRACWWRNSLMRVLGKLTERATSFEVLFYICYSYPQTS